jgi:hypothetical protein
MTKPEISLTALERELMTYVEKLTEASEQSAIQFKELEESSRKKNLTRYKSLASSLLLVIESQVYLAAGLNELASSIGKDISKELRESHWANEQALEMLQIKG